MQPEAVVEVMGGSAAVHAPVRGLTDLRTEIKRGLPLEAFTRRSSMSFTMPRSAGAFSTVLVPEGSYKRRVKIGHLTPAESERVARLASVIALAEDVWGDPDDARQFLLTPHPEFGGPAPARGGA